MARYVDADKFIKQFERVLEHQQKYGLYNHAKLTEGVIKAIENEPTADVVPKSEVDRAYERGFERGKKDNVCGFSAEEIAQKAEKVAIELEAMRTAANSYKMHYENARVEVARQIFEEIEAIKCVGLLPSSWVTQFAELKKKYTEGE